MDSYQTFALNASYAQIAVFDARLDNPFNNWTDRHFMQGFAWRPRSVSFRLLIDAGPLDIRVSIRSSFAGLRPEAVRAIQVPFEVTSHDEVDVATVEGSVRLHLQPDEYMLVYEAIAVVEGASAIVYLTFVPSPGVKFSILRADSELDQVQELFLEAEPA